MESARPPWTPPATHVLDAVARMWDAQVDSKPDLMDRAVRARLAITHSIRSLRRGRRPAFQRGRHQQPSTAPWAWNASSATSTSAASTSLASPPTYEYAGQVLMGAETRASLYT